MHLNKIRRNVAVVLTVAVVAGGFVVAGLHQARQVPPPSMTNKQSLSWAITALHQLSVQPAAPKAGYSRKQFSDGWGKVDTCTIRDKILARDMRSVRYRSPTDCTVMSGTLSDPYTGKTIHFVRGAGTSSAVQIDHVVAISDAWQTGATRLAKTQREQLYNDPLELLAVDGPANDEKGDGDAAAWVPPNTDFDCRYVARQIAVKFKYHLWVTPPERSAMEKVLGACPGQPLPSVRA